MSEEKRLTEVTAIDHASSTTIQAYEIHIGQTDGPDCARAWLSVEGKSEGASSPSGRVKGSYLHGLFASDAFRDAYLTGFGVKQGLEDFEGNIDAVLDALAAHIESHMDLDALLKIARPV
jgi:adenosylcobyric acid synthase